MALVWTKHAGSGINDTKGKGTEGLYCMYLIISHHVIPFSNFFSCLWLGSFELDSSMDLLGMGDGEYSLTGPFTAFQFCFCADDI